MPRYTLDLSEDYDRLVKELADNECISKSEILRRAIAYYSYVKHELNSNGSNLKLSLTDKKGIVKKDIVII